MDSFEKIKKAYDIARKYNIDPKDKSTWNDEYKERQKELAGIKDEIQDLREFLESAAE